MHGHMQREREVLQRQDPVLLQQQKMLTALQKVRSGLSPQPESGRDSTNVGNMICICIYCKIKFLRNIFLIEVICIVYSLFLVYKLNDLN